MAPAPIVTNVVTGEAGNRIDGDPDRINAPNDGQGVLVDAIPAQESAELQSLRTRQKSATPAPSSLLSLFK